MLIYNFDSKIREKINFIIEKKILNLFHMEGII